jgi:DNA replication protein DnaC
MNSEPSQAEYIPLSSSSIEETKPCAECFTPVTTKVALIAGRKLDIHFLCDECEEKQELAWQKETEEKEQRILFKAFDDICPPLYRASDRSRITKAFIDAIDKWSYSPKGLIFMGRAGTGKTRSAWMLLKREHFAGRKVYGLSATEFSKFAADQWHSRVAERNAAEEAISNCKRCDILLLDDLGKQKFTERAELELFDLLEHRTSKMKPTITTFNADAGQFLNMLSEERGEPILRRLDQFAITINLNK